MIHHVFATRSNAGDWLSALGIQSLLAPLPFRELFCDEGYADHALAAVADAGPDDLVVIGGGGLLSGYFAPFWEGLAEAAGATPFVLWGVGACAPKDDAEPLPAGLLAEVATAAAACTVRDELTRELIAAAAGSDVAGPPVACPSLLAVAPPSSRGRGVLVVEHPGLAAPEVHERMTAHASAFAEATGRALRTARHRIKPRESALVELLGLYRDADVVVTSRLHGCLIGLASRCHVVAVSGDEKLDSFMDSAGLGAWVCDRTDVDRVGELLASLGAQPAPDALLERARQQNRAHAAQVRALAHGLRLAA